MNISDDKITSTVEIIHSQLVNYDKYLWFNQKKDAIPVTDNIIQPFRQMYMESELAISNEKKIRGTILYDEVLHYYTNAYVFYLSRGIMKSLINSINEQCNLEIDIKRITFLKLIYMNELYIVAFYYPRNSKDDLARHCQATQSEYSQYSLSFLTVADYMEHWQRDSISEFIINRMYSIYYNMQEKYT